MARLATRLAGPALMVAAPTTIYTAPAASNAFSKAVIRQIRFVNTTGGVLTGGLVGINGLSGANIIVNVPTLAIDQTIDQFFNDLAVEPGNTIQESGLGNATITVIGAIITPTS